MCFGTGPIVRLVSANNRRNSLKRMEKTGERGRNRTYNLLIKSQLLCQLSYAPMSNAFNALALLPRRTTGVAFTRLSLEDDLPTGSIKSSTRSLQATHRKKIWHLEAQAILKDTTALRNRNAPCLVAGKQLGQARVRTVEMREEFLVLIDGLIALAGALVRRARAAKCVEIQLRRRHSHWLVGRHGL
jgi:hypothetical protein